MANPAQALYSTLRYWRSAGLQQLEVISQEEEIEENAPAHDSTQVLIAEQEAACASCTQCSLSETRKLPIYGSGPRGAEIMFVGSSPSEVDEGEGRLFGGEVGELLDRMIGKMGFLREELYLCSAVKCRPPGDRNPTEGERSLCRSFLEKQIELIQPKIICTLGTVATSCLLDSRVSIADMRGKLQKWKNFSVMPTYHPAYLVKKKEARRIVWNDMIVIMEYLKNNKKD